MPVYEYRCRSCGKSVSRLFRSFSAVREFPCPHCRESREPDPEVQKLLGPAFASPGLYDHVSRGCDRCHHQGFRGRVALHEVLTVTESMRHVIASGGAVRDMVEQAESDGLVTLAADARYRVEAGETNLSEILRVLGSQIDI